MSKKIEKLRRDIDELDRELLQILSRRDRVVQKIGVEKLKYDKEIEDLERWRTHLGNIRKEALSKDLDEEYVIEIWNFIHKQSCKIQRKLNLDQ